MANQIGLEAVFKDAQFQAGLKNYMSGIQEAVSETQAASSAISRGLTAVGGAFTNLGTIITGTVIVAATAAAAAIGGIISSGVSLAAELEAQLDTVAAILGATAEEALLLGNLIDDLGLDPNLKVSATEAASAIEALARNGVELQDILDGAARSTVLLANATGADFANAANTATDVLDLFGFAANELETAVDGIVGVTTASKFSFDDYALALSNAGGTARSTGLSFNDFNATLATTSSFFAGGAQAGTSLNSFLLSLQPTTQKAADEFQRLGLITEDGRNQFFDATGTLRSMEEIIVVLQTAFAGLTQEQQTSAANTLFQREALGTVFALLDANSEAFANLSADIAATSAADLAAQRMANFAGAVEILTGAVETLQKQIGDLFIPTLTDLANRITEFITNNQDGFLQFFQSIADAAAEVLPRILEFVLGFTQAMIDAGPVVLTVAGAFAAFAVAAGPILIISGSIVTAIGNLIPVYTALSTTITTLSIPAITSFIASVAPIAGVVVAVVGSVSLLSAAIATNFGGIGTAVSNAVFGVIIPGIQALLDVGRSTASLFTSLFGGTIVSALTQVAQYVSGTVIPLFTDLFQGALTVAIRVVTAVSDSFRQRLLPSLLRLRDAFNQYIPLVIRLGTAFGSILRTSVQAFSQVLSALAPSLFDTSRTFDVLAIIIEVVATTLETFVAVLEIAVGIVENTAAALGTLAQAAGIVAEALGLSSGAADNASRSYSNLQDQINSTATQSAELDDKMAQTAAQEEETAGQTSELEQLLAELESTLVDTGDGFGELGDSVEETTSKFADYYREALQADVATIDLSQTIGEAIDANENLGDAYVDITGELGNVSNTTQQYALLVAEIKAKTDEYTESLQDGSITISEVQAELQSLFGARIDDINATIAQEQANQRLAETISGALQNAFTAANSGIGGLVQSLEELELAEAAVEERPWDQSLIDQAENARTNVQEKLDAINQAYRQMVFTIIADSDGVFDTLDAELGTALGVFTPVEAQLRLNEQAFQNSVTALFGTIESPNVPFVAALDAAVRAGEIDGESVDQVFDEIRTLVESGAGEEVQATIEAAMTLALMDGEVNTAEVENVLRAIDASFLQELAPDVLTADITAVVAATLDDSQLSDLETTFTRATDTLQNDFERDRVLRSTVDLILSGQVDSEDVTAQLNTVLDTVQAEGVSFNQALDILIQAEAETNEAEANLLQLQLLRGEIDESEVTIDAFGNVVPAVGEFQQLQNLITQVDGSAANATANAFVNGLPDAQTLDETLTSIEGTISNANVNADSGEAATNIQTVETGLSNIDGTSATATATFDDQATPNIENAVLVAEQRFTDVATSAEASSAQVSTAVGTGFATANASVSENTSAMATTATTNMTQIQVVTDTAVNAVNTSLSTVSAGTTAFVSAISSMVTAVVGLFATLVSSANSTATSVQTAFTSPNWNGVGNNIAGGIASGITANSGAIQTAARGAVADAIAAAEAEAGIASPSAVASERVGEPIPEGIAQGIEFAEPQTIRSITGLVDNVIGAAQTAVSQAPSVPSNLFEGIVIPEILQGFDDEALRSILGVFPSFLQNASATPALSTINAGVGAGTIASDLMAGIAPSNTVNTSSSSVVNNYYSLTNQSNQTNLQVNQAFRLMEMLS